MNKHLHNSLRALFLSLAVLLSLPMLAVNVEINGINYDINADAKQATVRAKSSGEYSGEVVIPESVEHDGTAYSVTSIGDLAFNGCSGLTSVTIPNSVTSIGGAAFKNCSGLTSVTIPNSVTSIGQRAFGYCTGLTSVVVDNENPVYDSRNNCNAIIETATNTLHSGCKTTIIPNSVTSIGGSAFNGCSGLTSVTIPNSVTSIGDRAFQDCSGLTSVTIPNSVTSIGGSAFRGCSGLTSVTIPNSVTSIGSVVFSGCSGLTSVVVDNENPVYDSRNNCNAIIETATNTLHSGCKTTIIPNSVTSIGDAAFFDCSGLTSVTIGNNVTSIGSDAFSGCSGLTSVTIPNSVTSIGNGAFYDCSGLTSVTIGNNVTSIEDCAFLNCSGLTSVTIPNSVTSIGDYAFSYSKLTSIYSSIPADKLFAISENVFQGVDKDACKLYIPNGSIDAYEDAVGWNQFTNMREMITPGYYTIRSMMSFNDGDIKALSLAILEGAEGLEWINWNSLLNPSNQYICNDSRFLWKVESVNGSDDEYRLVNMFTGNSFGGVEKSNVTELKDYITLTNFDFICNGTAPVTGKSVSAYAIRAAHQSNDDYAYIHCEGHSHGAGETGYGVGWEKTALASQWYFEPVDEETANKWMYGQFKVNGIGFNIISSDEVEVATNIYSEYNRLTHAEIPATVSFEGKSYKVTNIDLDAFLSRENLKSVTLPSSLRSLEHGAFSRAGISELRIPEGVISIGNFVAENCPNLETVCLPATVTHIGWWAFGNNSKLTSVYSNIPASKLFAIGANVFNGIDMNSCTLYVPIGAAETYRATVGWNQFKNITEVATRFEVEGIHYQTIAADKVEVLAPTEGKYSGNITIPATVTASWGTTYDVTQIGGNAFYGCDELTGITLGNKIEQLCRQAFCRCENLTEIEWPASLKVIGEGALSRIGISELRIPEGVTSLGKWAADNCPNLEKVYLPSTLQEIGERAFWAQYPENDNLKLVYSKIPAAKLFVINSNVFEGVSKTNCQLVVPDGAKATYSTTGAWNEFGANIVEVGASVNIADGALTNFVNGLEREVPNITYTRTLPNLKWNALYVPFEIPVSEIENKYEVAYINNIHSYDTDDNGTIDDLNMEIIKIKSGTLKANYPYLIKAKTDAEKQMNISLNNVMLFETKSTTIDCSSAYTIHNITGIYNRMSSNELIGSLAISIEGAWQPLSSDSHLNPFRLYMTITNRDDSPVKVEPAALSRVRISVLGEDSETGIEEFENENSDSQNIILDLSGRRVQNPSKGGVYIINGKKVVY